MSPNWYIMVLCKINCFWVNGQGSARKLDIRDLRKSMSSHLQASESISLLNSSQLDAASTFPSHSSFTRCRLIALSPSFWLLTLTRPMSRERFDQKVPALIKFFFQVNIMNIPSGLNLRSGQEPRDFVCLINLGKNIWLF